MFSLFKKPPQIQSEFDFPADGNPSDSGSSSNSSDDDYENIYTEETDSSLSSRTWPRILLGAVAFIGVAAGAFWFLSSRNAPVPAEIPQGDILATLVSSPSVSPPNHNNSSPSPKTEEKKATNTPPATAPAAPPKVTNTPPAAASQPTPPKAVNPPATDPKPDEKKEISQEAIAGIFGQNPFIDLTALRSAVTASTLDMPRIGANGNRALPDIPRPVVSPDLLPSPGEIRTPAGPVGSAASSQTMGGIIKGAGGNTIAIMGDGTVLSEGDTYKGDRRVTFIGGEGLQFDNGDSIPFGGPNQ